MGTKNPTSALCPSPKAKGRVPRRALCEPPCFPWLDLLQEPCFPQPIFLATLSTLGVRPESSFSALAKGQGILSGYGTVTCQGWHMGTGGDDSWRRDTQAASPCSSCLHAAQASHSVPFPAPRPHDLTPRRQERM